MNARRLSLAVIAGLLLPLVALPAHADVPVGWSDPAPVDPLHVLWLLVGIPVAIAVVTVGLIYLPPLARGESVAPGAANHPEWISGPPARKALPAASDEESSTGGASGQW